MKIVTDKQVTTVLLDTQDV